MIRNIATSAIHCCLLLMVCLFGSSLYGQNELAFSGYSATLPVYQNVDGGFEGESDGLWLTLNRTRFRPTLYLGDNTLLALEYEIDALLVSGPLLFNPDIEQTNRQFFNLRWNYAASDNVLFSHFLDRFYLRHELSFGEITIGRQRVAWGTGRVWNPTDLFSPINPATFDKIEKDGADLLTVKFFLGNFTDLSLVYNPRPRGEAHNAGLRFRSNWQTYDFSLIAGRFDQRTIFGGDFAGNVLLAGLRGEAIYAYDNARDDRFFKGVLGLDYQFTSKLYALLEYQHNGQGSRQMRDYDISALLSGSIINLGKNYVIGQTVYQIHPLISGSIGYSRNLDDESGFVNLSLQYAMKDYLDFNLGGQLFNGQALSEYGFYPDAIYLRGTVYF